MLETQRLLLREWQDGDRDAFAAMNVDPRVMEFFPHTLTRVESDELVDRMIRLTNEEGFSFAAIERKTDGAFVGMAGIARVNFEVAFCPTVEIGWRLPVASWGHGYASEAARAWLRYGFVDLELPEIVSFTAATNRRSQAVMQRIGMRRDAVRDFAHPALPDGHPLRPHVLYTLTRDEWLSAHVRRAT